MKYLITVFLSISILLSCQKTEDLKKQENTKDENLAQYLKIPIDNNIVFIGPLNSINNDVQKDYTLKETTDTIFIYKNFLESNDIDGAEIKFENSNADKQIKISYQIAYLFNGTEKANQFIDINYFFSTIIEPKNKIPNFTEIKKNRKLKEFLILNKEETQERVYDHFIKYYKTFSEEELKNCCPIDYLNYNKLNNISKEDIQLLDVENDLGAYLDYQSLIIEIPSNSMKKNIIVFSKNNELDEGIKIKKAEETVFQSNKDNHHNVIKGSYEITAKAISLYDKKEIDLSYFIHFNDNTSATLSIGAKNSEDYWCEGDYELINENGILHAQGKCDGNDQHDFYIKKENNQVYIKSKRFVVKDWQVLTRG